MIPELVHCPWEADGFGGSANSTDHVPNTIGEAPRGQGNPITCPPTCSSRQCLCFSEIWLFRACFSFSRFSRDSVDQSNFSSSHRAFSCGDKAIPGHEHVHGYREDRTAPWDLLPALTLGSGRRQGRCLGRYPWGPVPLSFLLLEGQAAETARDQGSHKKHPQEYGEGSYGIKQGDPLEGRPLHIQGDPRRKDWESPGPLKRSI